MDVHVYLHDVEAVRLLKKILKKEDQLMATMQELQAAVQRNSDVDDSVIVLLNGIVQQLKDALASQDPQAIQSVIDSIDADTKKMADAVTANTPAA
jgi:hypothetical protein